MESPGEKLKTARNEKGLSIDQVSHDTNITIRYIEALEEENYSVFPGEPYIIGFLKNYSAYLELDVQKILSLYKALRIQEQPVPVEQLLKHPPKLPKFIIPAVIIFGLLGAGGYGIYQFILNWRNRPVQNTAAVRVPVEYIMEGNSMERRFYKNDSVLIQLGNEMYKLELSNLSEAVTIRTPGGSVILDLSQEANIDLNNDGISELRITVADFARNNADMGALMYFYLMDADAAYNAAGNNQNIPFIMNPAASVSTTIIPASPSAYPFTLQSAFQGYCMFRWEILNERDRRDRNEKYFQRSDELNIQAQNGIRIWSSNAQAAKFQIIGGGRSIPLEIGTPGEVVVADIRWIRDDSSQYRLMFIRLETGS
ncbi:MAG: helix-turn-helix domain-containing protein [Spirochaetes bacterium]|nr:helix-turn-helix domain-containing protein [Brevinematales bacterium]MCL1959446.1 helix-turn-helix domain-containing protein [Spirochaetota bacterium]